MPSNPPLEDVSTYLIANGPSLTSGVNFFGSFLPDQPDSAVAVSEYPGGVSDFVMGVSNYLPVIEEARFQVMSRDSEANYAANETRIETIYRVCLQVAQTTIGGTVYQRWQPIQRPFFLDRDEKRRIFHAFNFIALRSPV